MGVGACVLHTNRQGGEMRKNQTLKEILDIGSIYIDIDGYFDVGYGEDRSLNMSKINSVHGFESVEGEDEVMMEE